MLLYVVLFGVAFYLFYRSKAILYSLSWLLLRLFSVVIRLPVYEQTLTWRDFALQHQTGDWQLALQKIRVDKWNVIRLENLAVKIRQTEKAKAKQASHSTPRRHHPWKRAAFWVLKSLVARLHFAISLDTFSISYSLDPSISLTQKESYTVSAGTSCVYHRGRETVLQVQSASLSRSADRGPIVYLDGSLVLRYVGKELSVTLGKIMIHAREEELQNLLQTRFSKRSNKPDATAKAKASAQRKAQPRSSSPLVHSLLGGLRATLCTEALTFTLLETYEYRLQGLGVGLAIDPSLKLSLSCQPWALDYRTKPAEQPAMSKERFRLDCSAATHASFHLSNVTDAILETGPLIVAGLEKDDELLFRLPKARLEIKEMASTIDFGEQAIVIFDYFSIRALLEPVVRVLDMVRASKRTHGLATSMPALDDLLSTHMKWLHGVVQPLASATAAVDSLSQSTCWHLPSLRLVYRFPTLLETIAESEAASTVEATAIKSLTFQLDRVECADGKWAVRQASVTIQQTAGSREWPWMSLSHLTWHKNSQAMHERVDGGLYAAMLSCSVGEIATWHQCCEYSLAIDDWRINFNISSATYQLIDGIVVPLKSLVKWIKGPVDPIEDWSDLYLLPVKLASSLAVAVRQLECKWSEDVVPELERGETLLSASAFARLARLRKRYERDRRAREALFWRVARSLHQDPDQEHEHGQGLQALYNRYLEAESLIYCRLCQRNEKHIMASERQCLLRVSLTDASCAMLPYLPMLCCDASGSLSVNNDWVSALSYALYGRGASSEDTIEDFETMKGIMLILSFSSLSFRLLEASSEPFLDCPGLTRLAGPVWIIEQRCTAESAGAVRLCCDQRKSTASILCQTSCQPLYVIHQLQLSLPCLVASMSSLADLPVLLDWTHGWLEDVTRPVSSSLVENQRLRPLSPLDKLRWLVRGLPPLSNDARRWRVSLGEWSIRMKNGHDWAALQSHRRVQQDGEDESWASTVLEPWMPDSNEESSSSVSRVMLCQKGTLSLRASLTDLSVYQNDETLAPFSLYDSKEEGPERSGLLLAKWQSFKVKLEMLWHPTQSSSIRHLKMRAPTHFAFSSSAVYDPFADIACTGLALGIRIEPDSGPFYLNDWPHAWDILTARILPPPPLLALVARDKRGKTLAHRDLPLLQSVRLSCSALPAIYARMLRLKSESEWIGFLAHAQNATPSEYKGYLYWHWRCTRGTVALDFELAEIVVGTLVPYQPKEAEDQSKCHKHTSGTASGHQAESEAEEWQWLDENFEAEMKQLVLMIPGVECQLFAMIPRVSFIQTSKEESEQEGGDSDKDPELDVRAYRIRMYKRAWNAACDALSALDPLQAVSEFQQLKKDIRSLESKVQLLQSAGARALTVDELKLKWHQGNRRIVFQFWDWLSSHNELRGLKARIQKEGGLESFIARMLKTAGQREHGENGEAEESIIADLSQPFHAAARGEKSAEMVDYIIRKLAGSTGHPDQSPGVVRRNSVSSSLSTVSSVSSSSPSLFSATSERMGLSLVNTWKIFFEFPQILFESPRPCLSGLRLNITQGALLLVAERASLNITDWATNGQLAALRESELAGNANHEIPIFSTQTHFTFEGAELYAQYRCDWQQKFRALWQATLAQGSVAGAVGPFLCSWPAFLLNSDLESQYEPELGSHSHDAKKGKAKDKNNDEDGGENQNENKSGSESQIFLDWRDYFERIMERTKLLIFYETVDKRASPASSAGSALGSDALRIVFPYALKMSTNSPAYCLLYDMIVALLVYSDPERKARATLLDKLIFEWRLAGPTTLPSSLRERMKRLRSVLTKYTTRPSTLPASSKWIQFLDYMGQIWKAHGRVLHMWRVHETMLSHEDKRSGGEMKRTWMADRRLLRQELLLLWLVLQEWQLQVSTTSLASAEKLPGVQVRLGCPSVEWTLLDAANSPMLRLSIEALAVDYHHYEDGSKATTAQLASTSIVNMVRGAYFRNFLRPLAASAPSLPTTAVSAATAAVLGGNDRKRDSELPHMWFYWRELAPVAGIAVLERVELWVGPTEWSLSHDIDKRMIEFLFPLRNPSSESTAPDEQKGSESYSVKKDKEQEAQDNDNVKDDEDAEFELMKERASSRRSFVTILIPSATHLISYKGRNEKARNLEDLDRMPLMLSDLEYKNRTLSWLELLLAIKKDAIKMLLANASTLVREKFGRRKKPGAAADESQKPAEPSALPRISLSIAGTDEESPRQPNLSGSIQTQSQSTSVSLDAKQWSKDDIRKRKLLGLLI